MADVSDTVAGLTGGGIGACATFGAAWLTAKLGRRDKAAAELVTERAADATVWRRKVDSQIGGLRDDIGLLREGMARVTAILEYLDPRK